MKLPHSKAHIAVPDGRSVEEALTRTTHLAIGAHPDDLEIMCWDGILNCFRQPLKWFTGITVTDGGGSPRAERYSHFTDDDMVAVREREQSAAAQVGEYSAVLCLRYTSAEVKGDKQTELLYDLITLLTIARPEVIYTHNLADKHTTHVAVAMAVIRALRKLPEEYHPRAFYGCEVWRNLDWLSDAEKQAFNVSAHPSLSNSLIGIHDSQLSSGKRYDLATVGRKRANSTYSDAYSRDRAEFLEIAMDLTPLLKEPLQKPSEFISRHIERFKQDVTQTVESFE